MRRIVIGLLLLAAAGFVRLGVWQLDRLHQRRMANAVTLAARRMPPVALGSEIPHPGALVQHRVIARGRYDAGHEVILRGDGLDGVPGVRIVTPLLLDGGGAVLVDRGFLPTPDAVTVSAESPAEPGEVEIRGIALPVSSGGGEPVEHGGQITWRRLDRAALQKRLPYPLLPVYIRQTPDSALPRFPRRLPPPPVDEGPHLSYALQREREPSLQPRRMSSANKSGNLDTSSSPTGT